MLRDDANRLSALTLLAGTCVLVIGLMIRFQSLRASAAILSESQAVSLEMELVRDCVETLPWAEALKDQRGPENFIQLQLKSKLKQPNTQQVDAPDPSNITVTAQHFDSAARIRLLPGLDGQPGTADFDDNANGVIDDAGELGATFSDDLCVVEASQASANPTQPSIVLQLGAYVGTHGRGNQPARYADRLMVVHEEQDKSWSFVVDRKPEKDHAVKTIH